MDSYAGSTAGRFSKNDSYVHKKMIELGYDFSKFYSII